MLTGAERAQFAIEVMEEVRRWPGVELRPHVNSMDGKETDGVEFRLNGRQFGHVHNDCALHLPLTRALKDLVVAEGLAEPLEFAPASGWAMLHAITPADAKSAVWLLRLNYVRLRRQRLTPVAAEKSALVQQHEAALGNVSQNVRTLLQRTQARRPRPLPSLDA